MKLLFRGTEEIRYMLWKNEFFEEMIKKMKPEDKFEDILNLSKDLSREIYISNITPQVADSIDQTIRFWNIMDEENSVELSRRMPIKIYINSYGGSLPSAFTIIDTIKISKTPVYTINTGCAYKEAFYIFLAGHQRFTYPRASFLIQRDIKQFDLAEGDVSNYNIFCEEQSNELRDMVLDKTKITEAEYQKRKSGWWITAEKAYELKICNEVLRTRFK